MQINDNLDDVLRDVFDYWFVQFDFPRVDGTPYKSSGGKMKWSDEIKSYIPTTWNLSKLKDICTIQRGISYSSKTLEGQGVPMINLGSFGINSAYKHEGIKTYNSTYTPDQIVKPYDLVMCNTQQTAIDYKKDVIGRSFLVPDIFNSEIVCSHHVTRILPKDCDYLKFYLNGIFATEWFHKYIAGYASGTNILGLDPDGILEFNVIMPSEDVISMFAKFALAINEIKSKLLRENMKLKNLVTFLLPLCLSGKLRF